MEPYSPPVLHVHCNPVAALFHVFSSWGPWLLDKALSRILMVIMIAGESKARWPHASSKKLPKIDTWDFCSHFLGYKSYGHVYVQQSGGVYFSHRVGHWVFGTIIQSFMGGYQFCLKQQLHAVWNLTKEIVRKDLKEAAMWGIVFFLPKDYFMLVGSIIFWNPFVVPQVLISTNCLVTQLLAISLQNSLTYIYWLA